MLGALGDVQGQRGLVEERQVLSRAAPQLVPAEPWFTPPRPKGNELASILILCCNQLRYTRLCLESLLRHTRPPYELVIVDNASTDGTGEYLEALRRRRGPAHVEVIRNATNRGFAAGCNQALERARGRYLVFLNNDTVLTPGWLDGLVKWSLHDWPNVGMVGPVTNGAPAPQGIRVPYQLPAWDGEGQSLPDLSVLDAFAARRRRDCAGQHLLLRRLTGFCLLARREVFERIGPLDERFGIGFFEDDDLGIRTREAGFRLLMAQDVYVHHFGNSTFKALGIDTRQKLAENFALFKGKWGMEHAAGYHLPPEPAADEARQPEEQPQASAAADERAEAPPPPVPFLEPAEGRPHTSLCMIVKNEEKNLPDCLRSVEGLFGEIVIADTGSADNTRDVARRFGARVVEFPWCDSFGAARNASLGAATGKWVMWLDADDRLDEENRRRLRDVLTGLGDELDAYAMKVRSVLDPGRTAFRLLDQVRLFRNLPQIRWDYRIHEQILPAVNRLGGGVRWADVVIDHVGYQDPALRQGKLDRNLRLLEMEAAEKPDDSFALFNLGWTLMDLGRHREALPRLQRSLERVTPQSSIVRKLYHLLSLTHRLLGESEEALKVCRQGLGRFPDDGELLLEEGLFLRDRGDWLGAEQSWLRLLYSRKGNYFASEEVGLRGYKTRQLLAEVYLQQDRLVEAEAQLRAALAERPDFEPSWMALGEVLLRSARWAELEELTQRLEKKGAPSPRLGWLKARGQVQRGDFAAARQTLEAAIARDGKAFGLRVLLSHALIQEGRDWEAAERALRSVLALDPAHAETRHNLAVLLRRLGRSVEQAPALVGDPGSERG